MISVDLTAQPDISVIKIMSDGARGCYEPERPVNKPFINLKTKNFDVGHHTVPQEASFVFFIEGIAIGDITMGLHLNHPFYVSLQRSGRFCFGMFSDPSTIDKVCAYITDLYPIDPAIISGKITNYVRNCMTLFNNNMANATLVADEFMRAERPKATQKHRDQNAKKVAQEQSRMCMPVIFPTAVQFAANLYTIAAMYRTAWNPAMLKVTQLMVNKIVELYPELGYMFTRQTPAVVYEPNVPQFTGLRESPYATLLSLDNLDSAIWPIPEEMFPMDTLQFNPKFMDNNILDIISNVVISLAAMGQNQRHRTIRRGPFRFMGDVYCPPIMRELHLEHELTGIAEQWLDLANDVPPHLLASLAPYGTMVSYTTKGNLNAILHEQGKRLCFCTQEEIYNLSRLFRENIARDPECRDELLMLLSPPCYQCGKCAEGGRYCGRDLTIDRADFFPERKV